MSDFLLPLEWNSNSTNISPLTASLFSPIYCLPPSVDPNHFGFPSVPQTCQTLSLHTPFSRLLPSPGPSLDLFLLIIKDSISLREALPGHWIKSPPCYALSCRLIFFFIELSTFILICALASLFIVYLLSGMYELWEQQTGLACLLLCSQFLEQCLAYSSCIINMCWTKLIFKKYIENPHTWNTRDSKKKRKKFLP